MTLRIRHGISERNRVLSVQRSDGAFASDRPEWLWSPCAPGGLRSPGAAAICTLIATNQPGVGGRLIDRFGVASVLEDRARIKEVNNIDSHATAEPIEDKFNRMTSP